MREALCLACVHLDVAPFKQTLLSCAEVASETLDDGGNGKDKKLWRHRPKVDSISPKGVQDKKKGG